MRVKIEELKENLTVEFPDGSTWTFLLDGSVKRGGVLPTNYNAEVYSRAGDIIAQMPLDDALRQQGKAFDLVSRNPLPTRAKLKQACETLNVSLTASLMLLCGDAPADYAAVACAIHNRFIAAGQPGIV